MDEKLVSELEALLNQSEQFINSGNFNGAVNAIQEAKKKLRPIGTGTNGPEPKK